MMPCCPSRPPSDPDERRDLRPARVRTHDPLGHHPQTGYSCYSDLRSARMKILSMTRRVSALALFGAVAVLTASCGGSSGSSGGSSAGLPSAASITIPKADRFEPFLLEIASGGTVTFTNQDADAHTVVSMPTDPVDFKLF